MRELEKLLGRQVVRPRVEDLHDLRAAVNLVAHVHAERLGEVREVRVQGFRVLGHDLLGLQQVAVASPLHGVRRERPGRAHEAEHRALALDLSPQRAQDLAHEGQRRVGVVQGLERLDRVHRANGALDDRALTFDDVELDAHRGQGGEDVGEHDHAVGLERAPRLHGELDGDLGRLRAVPETVLVGVLAELRHVPASLAHQPHRRALDLFAARGAEQDGLVRGRADGTRGARVHLADAPLLVKRLGRGGERRGALREVRGHRRSVRVASRRVRRAVSAASRARRSRRVRCGMPRAFPRRIPSQSR